MVLGPNFATKQKEFYLFKSCQPNPCYVLHCCLSWRRVLGGGRRADSCRAGTFRWFPCRARNKAQNYPALEDEDGLSQQLSQHPWPGWRPAVPEG